MDSGVLLGIFVSAGVIAVLLFFVTKKSPKKDEEVPQQNAVQEREEQQQGNKGLSRMKARQRKGANNPPATYEPEPEPQRQEAQTDDAESDENEEFDENENENNNSGGTSTRKISKKKMDRDARKDMIKKRREAEVQLYEARKKRNEGKEEEESEQKQEELAQERALEEDLKKIREERERREEDEYTKMKAMMVVEEKGDAELAEEEKVRISAAIIETITRRKVVVMEDLAGELQIRTREVIDNIRELEEQGKLSGVMDDRGKYIFITKEEQEKVAKFIIRKGRVSIEDIALESNKLINLEPVSV